MPTICVFYGIIIQMFWNDHAPAHFHAMYAEYEVIIEIDTLKVIRGSFPQRALVLVLEWASINRDSLMENWVLCRKNQMPKKILPLQ